MNNIPGMDWYLKSERKANTFKRLNSNPSLTLEMVEELKLAQAVYEVVPLTIYTPYLYLLLRKCGQATSS